MRDNQHTTQEFQAVCQQQNEKIIKQDILIWDLEEEIRVLRKQNADLQAAVANYKDEIDKYGLWCDHQQSLLNSKDITIMQTEKSLDYYKNQVSSLESRVAELQNWCDFLDQQNQANAERAKHLEKKYGVFYKALRKLKSLL